MLPSIAPPPKTTPHFLISVNHNSRCSRPTKQPYRATHSSDDISYMLAALKELGIAIEQDGEKYKIAGNR